MIQQTTLDKANISIILAKIYFKITDAFNQKSLHLRLNQITSCNGYPILSLEYGLNPKVFISSGMHCDEWTQCFANLRFLESNYIEHNIPFISIPLINPFGLTQYPKRDKSNRRWNNSLESQWQTDIRKYLSQYRFKASIDMHEDTGFKEVYLYERKPKHKRSLGELILKELSEEYSIYEGDKVYKDKCIKGVVPSNDIKEHTLENLMFKNSEYSLTLEVPGRLQEEERINCGKEALESLFDIIKNESRNKKLDK